MVVPLDAFAPKSVSLVTAVCEQLKAGSLKDGEMVLENGTTGLSQC